MMCSDTLCQPSKLKISLCLWLPAALSPTVSPTDNLSL